MMTEQELNNLIRGKAQTSIPSIMQEIMRLSQALEQKARELESLHAGFQADPRNTSRGLGQIVQSHKELGGATEVFLIVRERAAMTRWWRLPQQRGCPELCDLRSVSARPRLCRCYGASDKGMAPSALFNGYRRSSPMSQQHFDANRSLTALEQNSTIIAVIEMSQSKWLVASLVPGVERQPLKKLDAQEEGLLKLLHRSH